MFLAKSNNVSVNNLFFINVTSTQATKPFSA